MTRSPLTHLQGRSLAWVIAGAAPAAVGSAAPLTPLDLAVLLALDAGDLTITGLVDALGVPLATVHAHVGDVVAGRYVERVKRGDRRATWCTLTPKGARMLRSARRHHSPTDTGAP
jgi:DNA-binding MarR family transcriptional regulator